VGAHKEAIAKTNALVVLMDLHRYSAVPSEAAFGGRFSATIDRAPWEKAGATDALQPPFGRSRGGGREPE
jgi:hypothetical protein